MDRAIIIIIGLGDYHYHWIEHLTLSLDWALIVIIGSGDYCLDQEEEAVAKGVRGVMQVIVIINIIVLSNMINVMTLFIISVNIITFIAVLSQ